MMCSSSGVYPLTPSVGYHHSLRSDLQHSMSLSPIRAKSVKAGKVKKSKTSKVSVDIFSIDTTTDDVPTSSGDKPATSSDDKPSVSGEFFSYGTIAKPTASGDGFSYEIIAFGKTSKEAKAATDDSASAKSDKIVPKVVRAMPTDGTTSAAANGVNAAAENGVADENAAVINGAGAFFVVSTIAAFWAMMA